MNNKVTPNPTKYIKRKQEQQYTEQGNLAGAMSKQFAPSIARGEDGYISSAEKWALEQPPEVRNRLMKQEEAEKEFQRNNLDGAPEALKEKPLDTVLGLTFGLRTFDKIVLDPAAKPLMKGVKKIHNYLKRKNRGE